MDELLAAASPRDGGPAGILVLPPEHHLLLLAAHSWAHEPLRRLRDIVDMALVAGSGRSRLRPSASPGGGGSSGSG